MDEKNKTDYTSNSHKSKEEPKKEERTPREKLISGTVIQKKKPLSRKIAETFTGDDAQTVGQYVLFDVIIPAAKSMISDAVGQGIERLLFGGNSGRSSSSGARRGHTNYSSFSGNNKSYSARDERDTPRAMTQKARNTHNFDEIILATRGEAETVLDTLGDLVEQYDVATVADLYDSVGLTGSFTDTKYGWVDFRGADIRRVRDGYLLILPKTVVLD